MDNVLTIVGHVGTTIDYRAGENGAGKWSKAEFRLASTRRTRRPDGEWVDAGTAWIMVQAWRGLAEGVRECVSKGDRVVVMGRLQTDEWADDRGELRSRTFLVADAVGHDLSSARARTAMTVVPPEPSASGEAPATEPDEEPAEMAESVAG